MSIAIKTNTIVAIEEESTEGTYVTPSGAGSFLQVLKDGFEVKPTKDLVERNVFSGTIGKITPRTSGRNVTGTIPVEARAHSTAGHAPEFNSLMKAALGTRRQLTSTVTTKSSGNTATVLQIQDADIAGFNVGDIILVKMSGAYHVSPITAVDSSSGTANITLLVAHPSGDIDDSVVIEKFTTYLGAETGHPTLSVSKYVDSAVRETAVGCRVNSLSIEGWTTKQLPSFKFGFEGLDFTRSLTAPSYTPSYDSALPPILINAAIYQDGTALTTVNELKVDISNTLGFATAFTSSSGKISSRIVERSITGSFNPYKPTDSIANYTKFLNNTEFSLFAYCKNDSSTSGQFSNIVALYMPKCIITSLDEADADGLLQDSINFTASRGSTGSTNEIYISFI